MLALRRSDKEHLTGSMRMHFGPWLRSDTCRRASRVRLYLLIVQSWVCGEGGMLFHTIYEVHLDPIHGQARWLRQLVSFGCLTLLLFPSDFAVSSTK